MAAEIIVKGTQPDESPSCEKEYGPADCAGKLSVNEPGDGSNTAVIAVMEPPLSQSDP